jgi:hypothetical protein
VRRILLAAAVFLGLLLIAREPRDAVHAQSAVWFRASFDNLHEAGTNMYNFANRYAQSATTWQTDHRPTGGWRNSGGAHVVVKGCTAAAGRPCNTSENQFNIGWVTPPIGRSFVIGDAVFLRFRIKFDPGTVLPVDGQPIGAKFALWGQTRTTPNSRWIIHLEPALHNQGCTLGFNYGWLGWTPPAGTWYTPAHWGLPNFATGRFFSFQSNVNVSWDCHPAVLVHASDASPARKPNANGAAPIDGWYHLQFQAVSGLSGGGAFRTWANTNVQSAPSSERVGLPDGLGVTGWNDAVYFGGYWGIAQIADIGFTVDDLEVGPTFDPSWYPGASSGPATPPSPGNFRLTITN